MIWQKGSQTIQLRNFIIMYIELWSIVFFQCNFRVDKGGFFRKTQYASSLFHSSSSTKTVVMWSEGQTVISHAEMVGLDLVQLPCSWLCLGGRWREGKGRRTLYRPKVQHRMERPGFWPVISGHSAAPALPSVNIILRAASPWGSECVGSKLIEKVHISVFWSSALQP